MKFAPLTRLYTGVALPLACVRSKRNAGVGDFYDLPLLGELCTRSGLDLIQLLPVNDTGYQSSPYSALSAYALHPLYLAFDVLPELEDNAEMRSRVSGEIAALRSRFESAARFPYDEVLSAKLELARAVFRDSRSAIENDSQLADWLAQNEWVRTYAAFRVVKDENQQLHWRQWPRYTDPDEESISEIWSTEDYQDSLLFYAWLQYRLTDQLATVSRGLGERGIYLKGDLPILMNEDSADVWAHRELFIPSLRAGAPPDMFSEHGQNWDFPVYDWDEIRSRDFAWWKRRLSLADRFYHAFRIDHVLGFFRMWAVPSSDETGTMGFFYPSKLLTRSELQDIGLDDGRIRWLAEPHVYGAWLREAFGEREQEIRDLAFTRIGDEDLYRFSEAIAGERDIQALELDHNAEETLLHWYRDRALIEVENDEFAPAWLYRECSRISSLSEDERRAFDALVDRSLEESESIWERQGRDLLSFMNGTADMLTCAEDLGVIPRSVPETLSDLGILSLRVPRWARRYDEEGEPFIPVWEYPFLSVCAASVHDTSTLRQWWAESDGGREAFWRSLGRTEDAPVEYDPRTAMDLVSSIMKTSSAICMFQLQDFLAMSDIYREEDPDQERINVPGTDTTFNWTYRMKPNIEAMLADEAFTELLRSAADSRKAMSSADSPTAADSRKGEK
jgi:4-alpha-glucanotransferase